MTEQQLKTLMAEAVTENSPAVHVNTKGIERALCFVGSSILVLAFVLLPLFIIGVQVLYSEAMIIHAINERDSITTTRSK